MNKVIGLTADYRSLITDYYGGLTIVEDAWSGSTAGLAIVFPQLIRTAVPMGVF
jgi:hypothetical protein